jgi:hypothetical protein
LGCKTEGDEQERCGAETDPHEDIIPDPDPRSLSG